MARINPFLAQQLNSSAIEDSKLKEAVAYSLLAGGKRVRPLLVYATADALGVPFDEADHVAAAIEMIHAYSLIHDDLPSMDDDDLRRGKPTCHIQFDEATAILAGDALQAMAFEVLSQTPSQATQIVKIIQIMSKACGLVGMAGGQSLDLEAENKEVRLSQLQKIHAAKTGALLIACVDMICALSDNHKAAAELHQFANHFGMAFQIVDDILDVTADTETLGKPAGSDEALNKSTYPSLMGLSGAKDAAEKHIHSCFKHLEAAHISSDKLTQLTHFILNRAH
nr:farnesyl diphosphate synthase [Marinicella rhabdoformis]